MLSVLADVLNQHMVLVFFVYGLAWFSMALAIVLTIQKKLHPILSRNLPWLAAFGFVHAVVEWIDMVHLLPPSLTSLSQHPALPAANSGLLGLSALLLVQFGVGMMLGFRRWRGLRWLPLLLVVLWLASPLYGPYLATMSGESPGRLLPSQETCARCHSSVPTMGPSTRATKPAVTATLGVFARYLLFFPGLILGAAGFYLMARLFSRDGHPKLARDSLLAALALGTNSFFSGLVVSPSPYLLGAWLNYHTFVSAVGAPPQALRGLMAVVASFFIVRVLRVYRIEQERQLERANEERLRAEHELSSGLRTRVADLTRALTELHAFGERVTTSDDLSRVLQGLTEVTARLLQADGCAVYMLTEGPDLKVASASGTCAIWGDIPPRVRSCLSRVMDERSAVLLSDAAMPDAPTDHQDGEGSLLVAPMTSRSVLLGAVGVHARRPRLLGDPERFLLETISAQAAVALHNSRLYSQVAEQSIRDGLTGLYNHRYFQERLEEELKRAGQSETPLSLLFCDIDSFKAFNDANGHPQGDRVLQEIGRILKDCSRATDIAARYGGEEFVVILPGTDAKGAMVMAERIRREVAGHAFMTSSKAPVQLTMSIGTASFPADASSKAELIDKADWAMYAAKRKGRNQTNAFSVEVVSILEARPPETPSDNLYLSTVHALAAAVDARDHYTRRHSEMVAHYATAIAQAMALPQEEVIELTATGLLHDVGKIGIRDDILNKPGPLSEQEWELIRSHPQLGEDIVKHVRSLVRIVDFIRHHHERYDGKGYPDGLAGEDIPLGARIIAVADSFHAMRSDRPYRSALSLEQTLAELRTNAGRQFDPQVVATFIEILRHEGPAGTG